MTAGTPAEPWRAWFDCPDWCTTSLQDHRDDDPGRPMHDGPVIAGFQIGQVSGGHLTGYLDADEGEKTAQQLRQLAADALVAAEWLEAHTPAGGLSAH